MFPSHGPLASLAPFAPLALLGLHPLDAVVVGVSLVAVLAIGVWVSRGVKGENEFFVSGRSMGPWLQFFLNFGQATDSNGAPTIATEVYRQGVGGMWIGFQTLFITPFIWFTSVWFRRSRVITGPDLFVARFNSRKLALLFAWFSVLTVPLNLGLGNIISYKVAAAMMVKSETEYTPDERRRVAEFHEYEALKPRVVAGTATAAEKGRYETLDSLAKRGLISSEISFVSPLPFYLIYAGIVAVYIMLGGIKAAAITDAFQGILIIVFSVMMIPIGLSHVGGFAGLHERVPEHMFLLFGSASMSEYTWYSIAAIVFGSLVTFGQPGGPANAAARDENAARIGTLSGVFLKRFVMIAWMFCGLLAAATFPAGNLSDPDKAWGALASTLLVPGLMGLMIAGMLLGHMPAVGVAAVNFSAIFTRNLYEPAVRGRSTNHYLVVAQLAIFGVLALSVLFATFFTGVIELLTALITFNTFFGSVGFLIYFWRKLTGPAVAIGAVLWLTLMTVVAWGLPKVEAFRTQPSLLAQTQPYTVTVKAPADEADVAAGRAAKVGQVVEKPRTVDARPLFFERIARANPADPNSPLEGLGRFHVENYVLSLAGVPLDHMTPAGLVACRWVFAGTFPFLMLIVLSYATQPRRGRRVQPAETGDDASDTPWAPANDAAAGTALLTAPAGVRRAVAPTTEDELRIARFYARMKTPIGKTAELDAQAVAASDADPTRFDHLKLFPNTSWEFTRWKKADYLGFFGCWVGVGLILLLLWGLLQIGA